MTIVVHHLGISQSERILWLLEELGLDYKLVRHVRDPVVAPESLKAVPGNKPGKSPFIEDTDAGITLSESNAITDYIIFKHGNGRLALAPSHDDFADYLYWKDFANSTMQPNMITSMFLGLANVPREEMASQFVEERLNAGLKHMDERLGQSKWLAGDEFTAAETMSVYAVTTQRYFGPRISLAGYGNILRWLKDCAERSAYQKAMEKGDPEMKPLLAAEAPQVGIMESGGSKSSHWKK